MTQLANPKVQNDGHRANFSRFERETVHQAVPWLDGLRRQGMDRFNAVGFPGRRDERWRFTSVDGLAKTHFDLAPLVHDEAVAETARTYSFGRDAAVELVFVNGHFAPQLSQLRALPRGVRVQSLADALVQNPQEVEAHLARSADLKANPFVALNTGFIGDGAYVRIPRGVVVDGAIHLLLISAPGSTPTVSHPRVLVVAEENAQATLVESYVATGGATGPYFTNAVTEVVVGVGAQIDHCKLQQEGKGAYHIATMQVLLAAGARFVTQSATMGALLTRNDLNIVLAGEHADATLNGLVLLDGNRHCDNHTLLDHAAANCPSHELYKHVLAGRSTGVFKGQILVRKDSQKTDSKQTSKTLLLSDDAVMNSMPALEIYADDVKCTHGSTTGPMDEEQLFYLRSRGIGAESARHLMTYAFAADITRRIRVAPVRARIENHMAAQHGLPLDLRITDLGAHDEAVVNI
jgi:Fe-S cluster assembly protein SufD